MTLMVAVILFVFLINIGDYSESFHSNPDEKVLMATSDVRSFWANQSNDLSQANDDTVKDFLGRTLIILAVLLVLWSLCIYLAARLNLFMKRNGKNEYKTKGR